MGTRPSFRLLGIILLALLTISPTTVREEVRLVDVYLEGQRTDCWCWVASAKMALGDAAIGEDQCGLVSLVKTTIDCCTTDECDSITYTAKRVLLAKECSIADKVGAIAWSGHLGATDNIHEQILEYGPIISAWEWGGGGEHEFVVYGFKRMSSGARYVWVHDPLPVDQGDTWLHTYDFFVKARRVQTRTNESSGRVRRFEPHENAYSYINIGCP